MITLKKVNAYYGDHRVLTDIDLVVEANKVTVILGPNGAGKTTLLRTIMGQVRYTGGIELDGEDIRSIPRRILARRIALITQLTSPPHIPVTVYEALLTARYPHMKTLFETSRDIEAVEKAAEELGIKHLLHRRLGELSSGELQRVALATGIVQETPILLLDEPDNHIDPGSKSWLLKTIRGWTRRKTIVLTTHDVEFASLVGDHYVVLDRGRIAYSGDRDSLGEMAGVLSRVYGARIELVTVDGARVLVPIYI